MRGYIDFEFDLPTALLIQLTQKLDQLEEAPLTIENLKAVPDVQGVYQLFLDKKLVYIGKTDADAGLHKRLAIHARKIMHRKNLDPARVGFKAARIFVFTAMDLETELIRHYGGVKNIGWNGSGFGANDPGRERDTTRIKPKNYYAQFPIDIDRTLELNINKGETAADALLRLKNLLPYTLRYEGETDQGRKPHPDLRTSILSDLKGPNSCRQIVKHIVSHLPPGWQATALPGYIILYKESPKIYPQAEIVARSGTTGQPSPH